MSEEQVKGIPGAVLQAEQAHAKTCKGKNISDNELADNMRKLCATLCDVVEGWQKKCARSEQALADQHHAASQFADAIVRMDAEKVKHEQALAALEAENATLKSFQYNFEHATSLERAENEQKVAALEAERDEFKRKCEELCCAHGSALIEIHRGWADALAALEARNRELESALRGFCDKIDEVEPHINNAFTFMAIHGGKSTGPNYAGEYKAARAALKGAS